MIDVAPPAALLTAAEALVRRWAGRLDALADPQRADALLQRFADRYAPATLSPDRRAYLAARTVYDRHRPPRYDGPVTYYAPRQSPLVMGSSVAAWRRVAPQLTAIGVPGRHLRLLGQESVGALAGAVAAHLG
jgi:acetoacetyl-CoA synthetase